MNKDCYNCFLHRDICTCSGEEEPCKYYEPCRKVLLTRLETLEKALDLACDDYVNCPNVENEVHRVLWNCNEKECDEVQCWKDYFIHKAGDSQ
jgi:hypothetical protein